MIKEKMSVLHIITDLAQGGSEVSLYNLISHTRCDKFDHTVISLMDIGVVQKWITNISVPVFNIGMKKWPSPLSLLHLLQVMRLIKKPDIIQGWEYYGSLAASLLGLWNRSAQVVWNIHHTPYDLKNESFRTALLIRIGALFSKKASKIIYVSWSSKAHHEALGYSPAKGIVIPNGFDVSLFHPSSKVRSATRSELGFGETTPLIGMFARFHPMKDHKNFFSAVSLLAKHRPDVIFLLAGTGIDWDNPTVVGLIESLGVRSKIRLLGERSDVPRLYPVLDIFTVSSAWGEACPMVIGEAMASGVPCVVTDIGDSARLVGQAGIVIPPKDPQVLTDAWEKILSLSAQERKKLKAKARHQIVENYGIGGMVKAYENLYEEMLGTAPYHE